MAETIEKLGVEASGKRMMTTSNLGVLIRRHSSVALSDGSFATPQDRTVQGSLKHHDPETNKVTPTLYYAVPGTKNLHLLSFNDGSFLQHELQKKIPMRSTTTQTSNGNIYVVGGVMTDEHGRQTSTAMRDCLMIDQNLACIDKP